MRSPTRRELIGGGILGSVAALGGRSAQPDASVAATASLLDGAHGGPALIHRLLQIEQLLVFAYAHVLSSGSLSSPSAATVGGFLSHERTHAKLFSAELVRLGETPPAPPTDLDAISRQLASLDVPGSLRHINDEAGAIRYLIGVETLAERAYYQAMSKLSESRLLVLAASVMGCEAQHWTSLSGLLHAGDIYRAVPYPTVRG